MSILVVEGDAALARVWAAGLAERGYPAAPVTQVGPAMAMVRYRPPELLIGSLLVGGESLLPLIVAAEYRRADMATILLSDTRVAPHADLFAMFGSVRCVLGKPVLPDDLFDIAEHILRPGGGWQSAGSAAPSVCGRCSLGDSCNRLRVASGREQVCA